MWAKKYNECIICKGTKNKHHGKGICIKCRPKHDVVYRGLQIRYKRNPENKRKHNERRKNPETRKKDRERLKEYRKTIPERNRVYKLMGSLGGSKNKEQVKKDIKILKQEIARIKENAELGL